MVDFAFTVTYDGPTLRTGRLPIRHLSPALMALGELFSDASTLVDPGREPLVLELDTTGSGPGVSLVLCIPEQDGRITDLLAPTPPRRSMRSGRWFSEPRTSSGCWT